MVRRKQLLLVMAGMLSILLGGCMEKTLYPAVNLTVEAVEPSETTLDVGGPPGEVTISLKTEEGVPSSLEAFSISYFTRMGEPIPKLEITRTPKHQFLPPAATNDIVLNPYTVYVLDLYDLSSSDISPIQANMTLYVRDVNGNEVQRTATCLLHKPKAAAAAAEETGGE